MGRTEAFAMNVCSGSISVDGDSRSFRFRPFAEVRLRVLDMTGVETKANTGARKFNYRLMTVVATRDKSHCSMASLAFLALRIERPFSNIPMS